ncbi:galanin peptides isoform X1 [Gorilla gorilla gorilla]|uniref:galanin peptides isoform X1 n=1 Tax=Gorilla gorilla gorilla TaxID=9595 RepID=UPI00300A3052
MARGSALLLASLLLAAALSASAGLWSPAKEKRGWTLNSAGYLLGPHAVGNHRSFSDKNGLTSKRELQPEDDMKPAHWKRKRPIEKRTHRIPLGSSRLLIYIQSPVWLCVGMTEKRPVPSNASRISSPQPPQKTSSGPESLLGVFVCVL